MEAPKFNDSTVIIDLDLTLETATLGVNGETHVFTATRCSAGGVDLTVVDSYCATVPLLVSLLGSTEDAVGCRRKDVKLGYFKAVTGVGATIGSNIITTLTATVATECLYLESLKFNDSTGQRVAVDDFTMRLGEAGFNRTCSYLEASKVATVLVGAELPITASKDHSLVGYLVPIEESMPGSHKRWPIDADG